MLVFYKSVCKYSPGCRVLTNTILDAWIFISIFGKNNLEYIGGCTAQHVEHHSINRLFIIVDLLFFKVQLFCNNNNLFSLYENVYIHIDQAHNI